MYINDIVAILRADGLDFSSDVFSLGNVFAIMYTDKRVWHDVMDLLHFKFFHSTVARNCKKAFDNMQTAEDEQAAFTVFAFLLIACFCSAEAPPSKHAAVDGGGDLRRGAALAIHTTAKFLMHKVGSKNWFCRTRLRISNCKKPFNNLIRASYLDVRELYAKVVLRERPETPPRAGERFPPMYQEQAMKK
jgi:hypothetical protein